MKKIIKRREIDLSRVSFSNAVSPLLQRIYAARGALTDQSIHTELAQLVKPDSMKGLPEAVSCIADFLTEQKRILIVGDFDCDGATSTAVSVLSLRALGAKYVDFLVPNRFEFGYGLTPEIVEVAKQQQPDLIITVDNGIASIDGVDAANEAGITVVVTDHHLPGHEMPDAAAIVNPNQSGCEFPSKNLAGVGVIFYVMSALRSELRLRNWFTEQKIVEPNMAEFLDLVALGTVADVVPLDQNNRTLVENGLRRIRAGRTRPGIKALLELSRRSLGRLVSSDLGFALGPRLNAAGRLDDMSLGIQCLLETDDYQAREIAIQLDELNHDRKAIEAGMQREAMQSLQALHLVDQGALPYGLCLFDENWHQGVIGILASRIKDRYHRPVIAFAASDNGEEIKGSARSIAGLHIRDALDAVASRHPGLLTKFGGHAMAAGMTLLKADFEAFRAAFDQEVRRQLTEDDLQAVLYSDGQLQSEDFNLLLAQQLRDGGPWGQHFPEPVFDGVFYVQQQRVVGEKHLKMVLSVDAKSQQLIDAIAFNVDIEQWPDTTAEQVRLVYKLDINEFRGGQTVQLLVDYLEPYSS
jgi:single-stranded-DNA-specific exonuclease